jgi:hypothetical protein
MEETHPTTTDATTPPDRSDMLRAFLAAQDIECPSCRYNVRGLRTDVCPECNQKLTLRLALTEPRLAGFIAGLAGLTSGLGFHTVLAAFFTYYYVFVRVRGGPPVDAYHMLLISAAILGVMTWLWIANGGAIRRMSFGARWTLVLGTFAFSAVSCIIFFLVADD